MHAVFSNNVGGESDEMGTGSPPAMMTRSRTRSRARQSHQSDTFTAADVANEPETTINAMELLLRSSDANIPSSPPPLPPRLPPPQLFVQYLEGPRRKVTINESKSVIFELTQAIEEDSVVKMARLIEEQGVDVNYKLSFGISILLKATRSRSTRMIDYLIEKGADVESSVCEMMKRLDTLEECHHSIRQYDQWCIETLMKMLPNLGDRACKIIDQQGRTLLHLACFFPDDTLFSYLLAQGADPNVIDNKGSSVLSLLVAHRDLSASMKMIQSVLSLPYAIVDIRDSFVGSTPLFQSFLTKRIDIFNLLLAHGADPFMRTYAGSSLMHLPFLDCKRFMILYDLGLNVNARNNAGKRPLQDRQRFDLVFFIMVLLGREVMNEEFDQMEGIGEPFIVSCIKSRMQRGEFLSTRLQSLCRQSIRSVLHKCNGGDVTPAIYSLPIPNPLKIFLDVCTYAEWMLNSLSQNQAWRRF